MSRKIKLPGRDLVAKRLADLCDAERQLDPRGGHDVLELHEHRLRRFRPQIDLDPGFRNRTDGRLEHHVELAGIGQGAVAAFRTGRIRLANHDAHLVRRQSGGFLAQLLLDQVIGPKARLAGLAVDQRVIEIDDVPGGFPHARMHQDARVEPHDLPAPMHERLPPELLDVVLQLDTQVDRSPRCSPDRRRYPIQERRNRAACTARRSFPWLRHVRRWCSSIPAFFRTENRRDHDSVVPPWLNDYDKFNRRPFRRPALRPAASRSRPSSDCHRR